MTTKKGIFAGEIDDPVDTPAAVREKMERRALRSVNAVERRADHAKKEIEFREQEYLELMDDRVDQMKERYFVDRGVDQRVTAAQDNADVLKKEISAVSARFRNEIDGRVERFRDGMAVTRIEVDTDILTREAACSFIDNLHAHAIKTQDRIDGDFTDADTGMRRCVNSLEPFN